MLPGDAKRMSRYLTNLVSRSIGEIAVQPRVNPLFGPASTAPDWTFDRHQRNSNEGDRSESLENQATQAEGRELPLHASREAEIEKEETTSTQRLPSKRSTAAKPEAQENVQFAETSNAEPAVQRKMFQSLEPMPAGLPQTRLESAAP